MDQDFGPLTAATQLDARGVDELLGLVVVGDQLDFDFPSRVGSISI